jgi:hypothetical protein
MEFTTTDYFYTAIGAAGASLILFGFYRISVGRWTNKSFWYELDNIIGPLLVIIYSLHYHAYVSIVINLVWIVVAFRGLIPFAERYGKKLRKRVSANGKHR